MTKDLIYKDECFQIIGACFTVYKTMGTGFLESVYQECLAIEFAQKVIPYTAQEPLLLRYRDHVLKQKYQPDFICYGKIIIELKATSKLADEHRAQLINYLKATGYKLGLLVNFGHYPKLEYERYAN
jgi:GxxExxY protein